MFDPEHHVSTCATYGSWSAFITWSVPETLAGSPTVSYSISDLEDGFLCLSPTSSLQVVRKSHM